MNVKNTKQYNLYKFGTVTDPEGAVTERFADKPVDIQAYVYPASGRVQSEIYGERLNNMLNMMVNVPCDVSERDGIGIHKDHPDYRVISIRRYSEHLECVLEKV